jgi:hypothetical protein
MDAMHAAIKAKRSGQKLYAESPTDPEEAGESVAEESQETGMEELVAKLSPEQKQELMEILQNDSVDATAIEKGGPSAEEKSKISAKMSEPDPSNDNSDDIDMSMISSRDKNMDPQIQPRNLGERARMAAAQRLKSKGKL